MQCWMNECIQTAEVKRAMNQHSANSGCQPLFKKQPQHTGLRQVKYSAPWHFHFATVTKSIAGPNSGIIQQSLHLQATHLNQQDMQAGGTTCLTLSHTL